MHSSICKKKVFVGSEIWISGILLLPFIEIWDVTYNLYFVDQIDGKSLS
jgi:hypothetical protein